jgi:hypothetical protein
MYVRNGHFTRRQVVALVDIVHVKVLLEFIWLKGGQEAPKLLGEKARPGNVGDPF